MEGAPYSFSSFSNVLTALASATAPSFFHRTLSFLNATTPFFRGIVGRWGCSCNVFCCVSVAVRETPLLLMELVVVVVGEWKEEEESSKLCGCDKQDEDESGC